MNDMTTGSPVRIIIKFTIPILLGNLLQLAYSVIDMRLVGTFLGDHALAAVGATSVMYTLFIGFFMGIANGFAVMTARHFGGKNMEKVHISVVSSIVMGAGLAVSISILCLLFLGPIVRLLNVPDSIFAESSGYIRIIIAGLLITMLYDILIASARAIGDSVTPLLTLFLAVGLNIAGDILLLGVLHTGVWGAALATVAAQLITAVVCCVYILRRYDFYRYRSGDLQLLERPMMVTMMKTGLSMALMSCLISIGSFVLQTAINGLGNSYIVAQSAARRITEILMSVFVAIGHTMATYCSQTLGADRWDRIHEGMKAGYWITCLWCVAVLVIVYTLAPTLICMITGSSDLVMIRAATQYLRIDSILYVLVAVIFVQRNSMQGIGDTVTPLISSGIEMAGKIILAFTLVPALGYFGVILVEPIVWIVMIIPLILKVRTWER